MKKRISILILAIILIIMHVPTGFSATKDSNGIPSGTLHYLSDGSVNTTGTSGSQLFDGIETTAGRVVLQAVDYPDDSVVIPLAEPLNITSFYLNSNLGNMDIKFYDKNKTLLLTKNLTGTIGAQKSISELISVNNVSYIVMSNNTQAMSVYEFDVDATVAPPTTETNVVSSVGLLPGILSIDLITVNPFPDITLDGTDKSVSSTLGTIRVADATGQGEGWHLMVEASQFKEVGGTGITFPLNSLTLATPTSINPINTSSPSPSVQTGPTWFLDSGTPLILLSAATEQGMGSYEITFGTDSLSLNIPSNMKVVDRLNYPSGPTPYESTITFTIISGP